MHDPIETTPDAIQAIRTLSEDLSNRGIATYLTRVLDHGDRTYVVVRVTRPFLPAPPYELAIDLGGWHYVWYGRDGTTDVTWAVPLGEESMLARRVAATIPESP